MTPEELLAYDQLINPDDEPTTQTFEWGQDLSRSILGMILADRTFLLESLDLIKPSYFENKAHRAVSKIVIEHFEEWRVIPNRAIILEKLKKQFKDSEDKLFYLTEFDLCRKSFVPGLDSRDYNLTLLTGFAKKQAMTEAVKKVLEEIKKGDWTEEATMIRIYGHLDKAKAVDRKFVNTGHNYFRDVEERYRLMGEQQNTSQTFTSSFATIDNSLGGGLRRGELASVIALSGAGKSLWLSQAAWRNTLLGHKVLYISTEMSEIAIAQRLDALYSTQNVKTLYENQHIVKPIIKKTAQDFLNNQDVATDNMLIIKQFAPKSANVDTFHALLVQLQMAGWTPDMVCLDYMGECKLTPGVPKHESLEETVSKFRGLAVELNFFGLTAMQPNRSAREAQKEGIIDDSNLGDAYGQTRPLDAFWSINQRDDEKKMKVARIFCIKHRNGESRHLFYVQFNPETLEYREIPENVYFSIMQGYKEDVIGKVKQDTYTPPKNKKKSRYDETE